MHLLVNMLRILTFGRYVGNKVAVFVLQSLGCDTAALNTVQFSTHSIET